MDHQVFQLLTKIGLDHVRKLNYSQCKLDANVFVRKLAPEFRAGEDVDWAAIGHRSAFAYRTVASTSFMCGPLQAEPKKRKERAEATQERKKRKVVAEAEEPEEIDPSKEQRSQTDQRVIALQSLLTSQTHPVSLFDFAVR